MSWSRELGSLSSRDGRPLSDAADSSVSLTSDMDSRAGEQWHSTAGSDSGSRAGSFETLSAPGIGSRRAEADGRFWLQVSDLESKDSGLIRPQTRDTMTAGASSSFADPQSSSQALYPPSSTAAEASPSSSGAAARRRRTEGSKRSDGAWVVGGEDGAEEGVLGTGRWTDLKEGQDPRGQVPFGRAWTGTHPAGIPRTERPRIPAQAASNRGKSGRSLIRSLRRSIRLPARHYYFGSRRSVSGKADTLSNPWKNTILWYNVLLFALALSGLVLCICAYLNAFRLSELVQAANSVELALATSAAAVLLGSAYMTLIALYLPSSYSVSQAMPASQRRGYGGRSGTLVGLYLSLAHLLLWTAFALSAAVGYVAYDKRVYDLEGKLDGLWGRSLGLDARARVQDLQSCCGWYSPFALATVTQTCYSRSTLPGCKASVLQAERGILERFYGIGFGMLLPIVGGMMVSLLCAGHIDDRFGRGAPPPSAIVIGNRSKWQSTASSDPTKHADS